MPDLKPKWDRPQYQSMLRHNINSINESMIPERYRNVKTEALSLNLREKLIIVGSTVLILLLSILLIGTRDAASKNASQLDQTRLKTEQLTKHNNFMEDQKAELSSPNRLHKIARKNDFKLRMKNLKNVK